MKNVLLFLLKLFIIVVLVTCGNLIPLDNSIAWFLISFVAWILIDVVAYCKYVSK